jgi:hypothetical protein
MATLFCPSCGRQPRLGSGCPPWPPRHVVGAFNRPWPGRECRQGRKMHGRSVDHPHPPAEQGSGCVVRRSSGPDVDRVTFHTRLHSRRARFQPGPSAMPHARTRLHAVTQEFETAPRAAQTPSQEYQSVGHHQPIVTCPFSNSARSRLRQAAAIGAGVAARRGVRHRLREPSGLVASMGVPG